MAEQIKFSVVVPVYNSEQTLIELYDRLKKVFETLKETFEVIFVNDCSRDSSYHELVKLHKQNDNITVIDFFKNYGQQNALMCGFNTCKGEYIITIDDDLQNPPEEIPKLYTKIQEGYDAVFGSYETKKDKFYKNLGSLLIRRLNHKIFNTPDTLRFSSYRILTRDLLNQIKDYKTPYPYISGIIMNTTSNVVNENIQHLPRKVGRSNYTLRKLIRLSFNLVINYSSIPLRFLVNIGLIITFISLVLASFFIVRKLNMGLAPTGWTSLVVMISFYNAVFLGIFILFGIYISRIIKEISGVKQYSVKSTLK